MREAGQRFALLRSTLYGLHVGSNPYGLAARAEPEDRTRGERAAEVRREGLSPRQVPACLQTRPSATRACPTTCGQPLPGRAGCDAVCRPAARKNASDEPRCSTRFI